MRPVAGAGVGSSCYEPQNEPPRNAAAASIAPPATNFVTQYIKVTPLCGLTTGRCCQCILTAPRVSRKWLTRFRPRQTVESRSDAKASYVLWSVGTCRKPCAYLVERNLFALVWLLARPRRSKELEILVLRHELAILRRPPLDICTREARTPAARSIAGARSATSVRKVLLEHGRRESRGGRADSALDASAP
jgi:hypothetical protein